MPPTAPPPRPVRPLLRIAIATLKPLPTAPSTLSAGTCTSLKATVVVDEARMPILSSCGPWLTPGHAASTTNAVIRPSGPSVRANTVYRSAMQPLVIQLFSPDSVQLPSSLRAHRQSVVQGKSVSVRVDLGGRHIHKKKKNKT